MTFDCLTMLDDAGIDDPAVREAVLRELKQFLANNWACTLHDLIDHIDEALQNEAHQ